MNQTTIRCAQGRGEPAEQPDPVRIASFTHDLAQTTVAETRRLLLHAREHGCLTAQDLEGLRSVAGQLSKLITAILQAQEAAAQQSLIP